VEQTFILVFALKQNISQHRGANLLFITTIIIKIFVYMDNAQILDPRSHHQY